MIYVAPSTMTFESNTPPSLSDAADNALSPHQDGHAQARSNTSVIRVQSLKKSFSTNHVLNGVSFDVQPRESFVVMGGSGTGKSVLIKCILGLLTQDSGDICIHGVNISDMSTAELQNARMRFGVLFQGGALFDSMTVAENVAFGLVQGGRMHAVDARKIALEKLNAVDLASSVADKYPAELSGGMQKRAALARAIAANPDVIFFDEPTAGLDPIVSGTINDLIVRCVREIGASAITITHDMNSLRHIADRVALLFQGDFVWQGTVYDMDHTNNPYVDQFIHGKPVGPFTS